MELAAFVGFFAAGWAARDAERLAGAKAKCTLALSAALFAASWALLYVAWP